MNKYISILVLVFAIAVVSCDGRHRVHDKNYDTFKLQDKTDSEKITYIPEEYTEVVTDTLLSNGFRIKIKTYTDMKNGILDSLIVKDSITTKTIKRDFISEVTVFKDGKEILFKTINKSLFSDIYDYHGDILKDMTLVNVWINQFILANQDVAQIEIDYYRKPNLLKDYPEEYYIYYGLIVYADGKFQIKHMEY